MHILFADDNDDICAYFAFAFQVEGHTTKLVGNGLEAVAAVESEVFDAIVLDVEMPAMDGLEATERIRHLPNGQQVPILICTGFREADYRGKALAVGADLVMYKPLLPQVVLARLERLRGER